MMEVNVWALLNQANALQGGERVANTEDWLSVCFLAKLTEMT